MVTGTLPVSKAKRHKRSGRAIKRPPPRYPSTDTVQVHLARNVYTLCRVFAEEHHLGIGDTVSYLASVGLCTAYGWTITGIGAIPIVVPLPDKEGHSKRITTKELVAQRLVHILIDAGCPPEEIILSAEAYKNIRLWATNLGVRWEPDQPQDIQYPQEYDSVVQENA